MTDHQMSWQNEEELIQSLFAPLARGEAGAFGLTDDAALLVAGPGEDMVVSTDSIVAKLHLPEQADPADVAWKAIAVNVSDIVAKGAEPRHYLLALMVPEAVDADWLVRFARGLDAAQRHFGVTLVGGDTDRARTIPAPMFQVGVTMIGVIPKNAFVRRDGARPGDALVITGPIGNATLGLALETEPQTVENWQLSASERQVLLAAYRRPRPIPAIAPVLRTFAHASIDISDGLVKDAGRMARLSGCSARIEAALVPRTASVDNLLKSASLSVERLLTSGEDYCVAAAVAPEDADRFVTALNEVCADAVRIGSFEEAGENVQVFASDGEKMVFDTTGFDHLGG